MTTTLLTITEAVFDGHCPICTCKVRAGDPVVKRWTHAECYDKFVPTARVGTSQLFERNDLEVASRDLECRYCRQSIVAGSFFVKSLQVHPECDAALFPTIAADENELRSLATKLAEKLSSDFSETVRVVRHDEPAELAPFGLAVQYGDSRVSVLGTWFCRLDLTREEVDAILQDALYLVLDSLWRARQLVLTGDLPLTRETCETTPDQVPIRATPGAPFAPGQTRAADPSRCKICGEWVRIGEKVYVGSKSHAACVDSVMTQSQGQNLASVA